MMYALIGDNDVILKKQTVPTSKLISNMHTMSDDDLRAEGWYPITEEGRDAPVGPDQIKEGPFFEVRTTDVRKYWTVRDKTQAELDAEQAELDERADDLENEKGVSAKDKTLFRILFDQENRIRTLEGQPTITRQQFMQAVRTVYRNQL